MKFPMISIAFVLGTALFAGAALAQTGGTMAGPATGGEMSTAHMAMTADHGSGCPSAANQMSGGNSMAHDHMSGGAMSGGAMSGGSNHMAGANTTGCQSQAKTNK